MFVSKDYSSQREVMPAFIYTNFKNSHLNVFENCILPENDKFFILMRNAHPIVMDIWLIS